MSQENQEFYALIKDFLYLLKKKRLINIGINAIVALMFSPALLAIRSPFFWVLFLIVLAVVNFFLILNKNVKVRKNKLAAQFTKHYFEEYGCVNLGVLENEISRLRREKNIKETNLRKIVQHNEV